MSDPGPEPKVSVVIVSHNTRDLLRRALASVGPGFEAIVIDNGSRDGSADMVRSEFPAVRLLANPDNRGFGAANNQGIALASHPLVLLMNSDAAAEPGAIEKLAVCFGDPGVVAAGGKLVHSDGRLQDSCAGPLTLWVVFCEQTALEKAFPRSRVLSPYWTTRRLVDRPTHSDVEQVMGACLMFRPLETFDERFFLYCEDTDLCRRLREHGRIVYVPQAVFVHELGASSRADRWEAVARYNRGKELYFAIHRGRLAWLVCLKLDRLGALLRLVGWTVIALATLGLWRTGWRQVGLFARVLTAPFEGPPRPPRTVR